MAASPFCRPLGRGRNIIRFSRDFDMGGDAITGTWRNDGINGLEEIEAARAP